MQAVNAEHRIYLAAYCICQENEKRVHIAIVDLAPEGLYASARGVVCNGFIVGLVSIVDGI